MRVYLDSSVVLRIVLRQEPMLRGWMDWEAAHSSQLLLLEASRALDRARLEGWLPQAELQRRQAALEQLANDLHLLELDGTVLRRAAMPMSTVVRTLDAIHLASALIVEEQFGERPVFATHDRQQGLAAQALGFQLLGT
jgi:predicted nucleic acid-binding protein